MDFFLAFAEVFFFFFGEESFGADFFTAVSESSDFGADFAALFFFDAVSVPAAAAAGAGAAAFLRPKRLPRGGAAASSSRQVSSVTAFGSESFGIRALRLPSGM